MFKLIVYKFYSYTLQAGENQTSPTEEQINYCLSIIIEILLSNEKEQTTDKGNSVVHSIALCIMKFRTQMPMNHRYQTIVDSHITTVLLVSLYMSPVI